MSSKLNYKMEIQKVLKEAGLYSAEIDGRIGPKTHKGIAAFLDQNGIKTSGWNNQRKVNAMEQLLYKSNSIEVGPIDGLAGPLLRHAREVYKASLVPIWRDKVEEIEQINKEIVPQPVVSASKWPWQSNVRSFYGDVGTNQVKCRLPFTMVLAWDRSEEVNSYSCHEKVKPHMERIWGRTLEHYGYEKIKELRIHYFGGCLNVRRMRGGSAWSMHSWGIAIDIDPDRNALRTSWRNAQMSKPAYAPFVQFWYDEGAINLGKEKDYDAMHFQFARV